MTVTMEEVRTYLAAEEPNYEAAANLGPDAGRHLLRLVTADDVGLAPRAAYLAGLIGDEQSLRAVALAAHSDHDSVRVAAAAVLPLLPPGRADELTHLLLRDADAGVRKFVLRSLVARPTAQVRQVLSAMVAYDPEPGLRLLAAERIAATDDEPTT